MCACVCARLPLTPLQQNGLTLHLFYRAFVWNNCTTSVMLSLSSHRLSNSALSHDVWRPHSFSFHPFREINWWENHVLSPGGQGRGLCSFMCADKHGPNGLSEACGQSPESSALKQCWCWGVRDCDWEWETPVLGWAAGQYLPGGGRWKCGGGGDHCLKKKEKRKEESEAGGWGHNSKKVHCFLLPQLRRTALKELVPVISRSLSFRFFFPKINTQGAQPRVYSH